MAMLVGSLFFEVFVFVLWGSDRGTDRIGGIDIALCLQHLAVGERLQRGVLFHFGEVVQIFKHRFAVAGNGQIQRLEHNGEQTAGETVVVQIHTCHGVAGIQHHR